MEVCEIKNLLLNKKFTVFVLIVVSLLLVSTISLVLSTLYLSSKVDKVTYTDSDISISTKVKEELTQYVAEDNLDKIINVALFGIDAPQDSTGRSDSIMILTVDPVHKEIKLSSIMRDSYVYIPGRGMDKINHAFAFGDSVLALKTINTNFGLNVNNFMAVNFTNMPKIINKLGGVTINITDEEVPMIPGVSTAGPQLLTGEQALSYSRIRYAAGNDYQRTARQRTVLSAIFYKVKDIEVTEYPALLDDFLPLVQTNFSVVELLNLGKEMKTIGADNLVEDRFPRDGSCTGQMINGIYYLTFDINIIKEQMRDFIYKN